MLFRKDFRGRMSALLDEQLFAAGYSTYQPRANDERDPELVRLQFYLQLALALNEGDVDHLSLRGLLELEDNRVGKSTLSRVLDLAIERNLRYGEAIDLYRHGPHNLGNAARNRLLSSTDYILEQARQFTPDPGETTVLYVDRVAAVVGVDGEALDQIRLAVAPLLPEGLDDLVDHIRQQQELLAALSGLADAQPATLDNHITLTTMHGAKGLTADMVIVCQLEDEELPGDAPLAEQNELRRLLYVSLTRARQHLVLSLCSTRTGPQAYGRSGPRAPRQRLTRFLTDRGLTASRIEDLLPH